MLYIALLALFPALMPAHPVEPARAPPVRTPPELIGSSNCDPFRPEGAAASAEGSTTLTYTITEQGVPSNIVVVRSSGSAELDRAALRCAQAWRYQPALENGKSAPSDAAVKVRWHRSLQ